MLVVLSTILRQSIRADDTVARLSGDDFALLVAGDAAEAEAVALRLLRCVQEYRLRTPEGIFDITISAGSYALEAGDTPAHAFGRADQALYEAKARGKTKAHRWCGTPGAAMSASRAWSPKLKDAVNEGAVEAHLQPIVSLGSGQLVFHEALCRIRGRVGQPLAAAAFIQHAEMLGLMPQIDLRMLEQV
jgi:predicted signal transduction protein with EAL and GGDEF domain